MIRAIDHVFWLVGDPSIRNAIVAAKTNARDEDDNYHQFVDLADYQRNGWDARLVNARSESFGTMRERMQRMLGEQCGKLVADNKGQSLGAAHYAPGKVLGKKRD